MDRDTILFLEMPQNVLDVCSVNPWFEFHKRVSNLFFKILGFITIRKIFIFIFGGVEGRVKLSTSAQKINK